MYVFQIFRDLKQSIDTKLLLRLFIYTLILGLFTHGYCYVNYIMGHDAIVAISSTMESCQVQWKVILGRFVQPVIYIIRGPIAAPWLLCLLAICWFTLTNYFIVQVFEIKSRLMQFIVCGLVCSHFSVYRLYATYIHEADCYALSFCLAMFAVYVFQRYKWGLYVAPFVIFISLGLYQAYYTAVIASLMLLIIRDIIRGISTKDVLLLSCKALGVLLIGLVLYYGFVLSYIEILGIETKNGTNDVTMSKIPPSLYQFGLAIGHTYLDLAKNLFYHGRLALFVKLSHILIVGSGIYFALKWCVKSQSNYWNKMLLVLLLVLLPFAVNLMCFLTLNQNHDLMRHSYIFIFLASYLIYRWTRELKYKTRCFDGFYSFFLLCLIGCDIVTANQIYMAKVLIHQRDLMCFTKISTEIERCPDYIVDETEVVFVGGLHKNPYARHPSAFAHLDGYIACKSTNITSKSVMTFYAGNLGYPIKVYGGLFNNTPPLVHELRARDEFIAMPFYPQPGYCRMIDGRVVVKLSE